MCFDFILARLGLRFGKPEDLAKQMLLPAPFLKKWQNGTY
jgi:hypothetical protein